LYIIGLILSLQWDSERRHLRPQLFYLQADKGISREHKDPFFPPFLQVIVVIELCSVIKIFERVPEKNFAIIVTIFRWVRLLIKRPVLIF
jgi:hypothetical protein